MNNQREYLLVDWLNRATPYQVKQLEPVSGDASFRRYFRFTHQNQTFIAADAPPETEDSAQFVALAQALKACGLTTPNIYFYDLDLGFLCLEDFGDNLFGQALTRSNSRGLYAQALALIPKIQTLCSNAAPLLPIYDKAMVQFELELFIEWFLGQYLTISLDASEFDIVRDCFDMLTLHFTEQPQAGVHRDFHSRNLMMLENGQIGVIDFQGAVNGPFTYDAASLLGDCYVDHPRAFVLELLNDWHNKFYPYIEWTKLVFWFDMTHLQRLIKIAGIFCRLALRDNKPAYLHYLPHVVASIADITKRHDQFEKFHQLINIRIKPELERQHAQ